MMKNTKNLMLASVFAIAAVALLAITSPLSFGKSVSVTESEARAQENQSNVIDANSWQVTGSGTTISKSPFPSPLP
jgi:hypothetical protein